MLLFLEILLKKQHGRPTASGDAAFPGRAPLPPTHDGIPAAKARPLAAKARPLAAKARPLPVDARPRAAAILATAALATASLAVAATTPAAGQTITGGAFDLEHGRPLAGAALLLVDSAGATVDSTRAAADGGYRLQARRAGTHFVHVQLDGWTGVPSDGFVVEPGRDLTFDVRVPLIGAAALRQMGSILDDGEMQRPVDELCGEPLRPWEAGVLLGVVRDRRTKEPVPGARVTALGSDGQPIRSTVSSARGSFILCNLPATGAATRAPGESADGRPSPDGAGPDLRVVAETADGWTGTARPEIRAGLAAWHDVLLTRSPPR